jgi:hypothetical protein
VYVAPEAFVSASFGGQSPAVAVLWLTRTMREQAAKILGHEPAGLRVRYWAQAGRTAWVLDEVGRTEPITVGVVVDQGRIERLQVLIYRESHGAEVRLPQFTGRFEGAGRKSDGGLDRSIDGISGATLSVAALQRVAELALYLHSQVPAGGSP